MDLITDLPFAEGYDSILVMVDQGLSKGVILIPCNKTITSVDTERLLLENLYKRFGLPDKIISDRGPQFASKAFIELLKLLGIKSALSMAYHPQTDGTTEQVTKKLKHTYPFTVLLTQKNGPKLYTPWSLLITTDDMQIDNTPHLNLCLANLQRQSLCHLKIQSIPQWKKRWEHYYEIGKKHWQHMD